MECVSVGALVARGEAGKERGSASGEQRSRSFAVRVSAARESTTPPSALPFIFILSLFFRQTQSGLVEIVGTRRHRDRSLVKFAHPSKDILAQTFRRLSRFGTLRQNATQECSGQSWDVCVLATFAPLSRLLLVTLDDVPDSSPFCTHRATSSYPALACN